MIDIESKIISYREDTNDYRLCLTREEITEINQALTKREQIRAEVIEELLKQVRKEEKWLFKVIGSNQNINIAFGGIYAKAEQLTEQKNNK